MDPQQNNQSQNNQTQNSAPNVSASQKNTVLAVLSYFGPLVIISYLMGKDNDFVKFHAGQGMVLFGIEVLVWILGTMFYYQFGMLLKIIELATLILSIIGIVNAVQGNKKELPLVGSLAKSFNL